jgi:hypothetical protein
MTDKTTKLLLAAIAFGLFLNVFVPLLQPTVVNATTGPELSAEAQSVGIAANQALRSIATSLRAVANGNCGNNKIC